MSVDESTPTVPSTEGTHVTTKSTRRRQESIGGSNAWY
jgi:hypothetical protein